MPTDIIRTHIKNTILKNVYRDYYNTEGDSTQSYAMFLKSCGLDSVGYATVSRWMKHPGYKYDEHKKSYYTDGHERPDVVDDCNNRFLDGYFEAELRAYRWVQIEYNIAKKLASEHEDFQ